MKVLICNKNLKNKHTGASRNVYEQIRYFILKGVEVHVVAESIDKEHILSAGATPHKAFRFPLLSGYKRRQFFSKQCDKVREKIQPDLVIGHGDYQNPDVHCIHNNVFLANEKIYGEKLNPSDELYKTHISIFKNRNFKHIIANSNLAKNDLISRFNIDSKYITVIYPAVNDSKFKVIPSAEVNNLRAELKINNDDVLLGLITSGDFYKRGVDILLKSLNALHPDALNKLKIILIGKKKLESNYAELIDSPKFKGKVIVLPIQQDIERYFNALDIFILPSRIEEFGRVVAEAMACGCPVITNTDVGSSELLQGKSEEFIYSNDNPEEISVMINQLLLNKNLRNAIAKDNLKNVKPVLESNIYNEFDNVYKNFI